MKLDPGHVVVAAIPGVTGTKARPTIVVSTSLYQATRGDVVVGLVTGQIVRATSPTDHVLIDWKSAGLRAPSAYRTFLYSLPTKEIHQVIGRLSDRDWEAVQNCLRLAIAVA